MSTNGHDAEWREIGDLVAQFVGTKIEGGCDHCDAYQTVEPEPWGFEGCYIVHVHHDDDCPWWVQYQNRAERRAAHKRSKRQRRGPSQRDPSASPTLGAWRRRHGETDG